MNDTTPIEDTRVTRRYFRKFERITQHMVRVAGVMEAEGSLTEAEVRVLSRYIVGLTYTFRALAMKYLFAGRVSGAGKLMFDFRESGFPAAAELMELSVDASQLERHLAGSEDVDTLKDRMVRKIVGAKEVPTKLQYALSQRLYYEELAKGDLFWLRNDPDVIWTGSSRANGLPRRHFFAHWAVYDSQINLPTVYLMDLEDSGDVSLPKDSRRWPAVQAHLMAQSQGDLKLLTIARGFDQDFDDLHPKRLRRFHLGPMYSHAFTQQTGPLRQVLAQAASPEGEDWALVWTEEELVADRVEMEKSGWFGRVERQIFALDPTAGAAGDTGATVTRRAIMLPARPYQALEELGPPGLRDVRKFVVSPAGRVLVY
ncbi:MAG: hypothetical protein AAGF13_11430 [Pseudomonadota bacterium]